MAAGDSFTDILTDPDEDTSTAKAARAPKPPKAEPDEDPLTAAAKAMQAGKGKVVVGDPSGAPSAVDTQLAEQAASQSEWAGVQEQRRAAQAASTQAFLTKYDKQQMIDKEMVAKYGTTDRDLAAQVKAKGALDSNFERRMQLDPEGGRAAAEETLALLGQGKLRQFGDSEEPAAPAKGRQYSVGTGAQGEPYYTNLTREELKQEAHTAAGLKGEPVEPSVTGLRALGIHDQPAGAAPAAQSPEQILFQGKLDRMRGIAEGPVRDEEKAKSLDEYSDSIFDIARDKGAKVAREQLHKDSMSGSAYKQGFTLKDMAGVETLLHHRTKPFQTWASGSVDRDFFFPDVKPNKKTGVVEDKSQPATVLNQGGGIPAADRVKQDANKAAADHAQYIADTSQEEAPTAFQYARRQVPSPEPTPGSPRGEIPTPAQAGSADTGADILLGRQGKRAKSKEEYEKYKKSGGPASPFMELFGGE